VTPRRGPSKLPHVLRRIGVQFERYPLIEALVLQDMSAEGTRRSRRIRELNDAIAEYAETYGIPVITYSREQVQGVSNSSDWSRSMESQRPSQNTCPSSRTSSASEEAVDERGFANGCV